MNSNFESILFTESVMYSQNCILKLWKLLQFLHVGFNQVHDITRYEYAQFTTRHPTDHVIKLVLCAMTAISIYVATLQT
jgi:hypothetical protein